jgi:hypothetical protein
MLIKIKNWLRAWLFADDDRRVQGRIDDLNALEVQQDRMMATSPKLYTTIEGFKGRDDEFFGWVKQLIESPQYRYLIFDLRENTLREMVGCLDHAKLIDFNGRLNMLLILDAYLSKGLLEHEDKIRGNQASASLGSDA